MIDGARPAAEAPPDLHPTDVDRMPWWYEGDLDPIRGDVVGSRHRDDAVRATFRLPTP